MKTQLWLRVFSITFLVQVLIITTTSISIQSIKDKIQDDDNLMENESDLTAVDRKETVGEPRWMSSYIFPLFPQFHNLDYNSVWNFLKRSDTIGYFVVRDVISVRKYIQQILYKDYAYWFLIFKSLNYLTSFSFINTLVYWIDVILGNTWNNIVGWRKGG